MSANSPEFDFSTVQSNESRPTMKGGFYTKKLSAASLADLLDHPLLNPLPPLDKVTNSVSLCLKSNDRASSCRPFNEPLMGHFNGRGPDNGDTAPMICV